MNFFGSGPKRPTNTRLTDKDGKVRQDWLDYFDSIGGQDAQNLLVGASPARQTAEHLVAGTSTVGWDLSTAGQPKPYVPDSGIGTDQVADGAVTNDKLGDDIVIITAQIADNAVTFAKIQQISTDTLLGRDTAGTGNVESISLTGGLEFSGSLSIRIADRGVTVAKVDASASGNRWGIVATVNQSDGGMEAGQYIDFHNTDGDTNDYAVRLSSIGLTSNFQVLASSPATTRDLLGAATDAEIRASSLTYAGISSAALASAAAEVTLTDAATIAIDWSTFINANLTITANRTLGNPTNANQGEWRTIRINGNSATLRTLTFGSQYRGDLPTITDISNGKEYMLSLYCVAPGSAIMIKSTQSNP